MIAINARYLLKTRISGVERYAHEVVEGITPSLKAHLYRPAYSSTAYQLFWEQVLLPLHLKSEPLLFNPCNLAPVFYRRNIVVLHDVIPLIYPQFYSAKFRRYYSTLLPLIANAAVHIITVSEFSRAQIIRRLGIATNKITVVYNGVGKSFSPENRAGEEALRCRYKLKQSYILYVGSLEPRKDIGTLLKAFAWAKQELGLKEHDLVIAGSRHSNFSGTAYAALAQGDIHFLGYVAPRDLPTLYACAELFVYPSICEGFGLPVLEAMASGTVALAAAGSSLGEVISDRALLFPVGDYKALADKIYQLIVNKRLREDYQQRALIHSWKFSWSDTARNTVKILEDFI